MQPRLIALTMTALSVALLGCAFDAELSDPAAVGAKDARDADRSGTPDVAVSAPTPASPGYAGVAADDGGRIRSDGIAEGVVTLESPSATPGSPPPTAAMKMAARPSGPAKGRSSRGRAEGEAREAGGGGFRGDIQSGTLTAGSFDDFLAPSHYGKLADRLSRNSGIASLARELTAKPVVITVVNRKKLPVAGAAVSITTPQGRAAVSLKTRTDGKVVLLPSWDGFGEAEDLIATVTSPGGESVRTEFSVDAGKLTVTLPKADSHPPAALDLAFIVDCTGSMSDELEYLKVEVKAIVEAIAEQFPGMKMRFGLVVYRDKGDSYVTRQFDFTDSLDKFRKNLGAQSAGGGGDYEEAVDEALKAAGQLRWSEKADTARVAFHIADAPPHNTLCRDALKALNALRSKAVAVYPVASSGVKDIAEFVMRSEALLTGSAYVFLTDDSGVGNKHAKPHFPEYHVERLDRLMIRMIASELSGRRVQALPENIIRKVG